jgi:hypothetical protein
MKHATTSALNEILVGWEFWLCAQLVQIGPSAFQMVKKLISCMRVLPRAVSIHLMNLRQQSNFKQSVFDVYTLLPRFHILYGHLVR